MKYDEEKKKHLYRHYEEAAETKKPGRLEKTIEGANRFMQKWRRPEIQFSKQENQDLDKYRRQQALLAKKKKIREFYKKGRRGIPGESILDRLGASANAQFGESRSSGGKQKPQGDFWLGNLVNSEVGGFGNLNPNIQPSQKKKKKQLVINY